LNMFYILEGGMITEISRGTLSGGSAFGEFELRVVLLMSLRILQWNPFRCNEIRFTPICTSNSPRLRFLPFLPSKWKTMQLKTLLYGVRLITTMIINHLTRWKNMKFKAPLYVLPLSTTIITNHLIPFLDPSRNKCAVLLCR
jgi:hypothetical protein